MESQGIRQRIKRNQVGTEQLERESLTVARWWKCTLSRPWQQEAAEQGHRSQGLITVPCHSAQPRTGLRLLWGEDTQPRVVACWIQTAYISQAKSIPSWFIRFFSDYNLESGLVLYRSWSGTNPQPSPQCCGNVNEPGTREQGTQSLKGRYSLPRISWPHF